MAAKVCYFIAAITKTLFRALFFHLYQDIIDKLWIYCKYRVSGTFLMELMFVRKEDVKGYKQSIGFVHTF